MHVRMPKPRHRRAHLYFSADRNKFLYRVTRTRTRTRMKSQSLK